MGRSALNVLRSQEPLRVLPLLSDCADWIIAADSHDAIVVAATPAPSLRMYAIEDWTFSSLLSGDEPIMAFPLLQEVDLPCPAYAVYLFNECVYVALENGAIYCSSFEDQTMTLQPSKAYGRPRSLSVGADIIVASYDTGVVAWSSSGTELWSVTAHRPMAAVPVSSPVLAEAHDTTLQLSCFKPTETHIRAQLQGPSPTAVTWSSVPNILAVGDLGGNVKIIDSHDPEGVPSTFVGCQGPVAKLFFDDAHPDLLWVHSAVGDVHLYCIREKAAMHVPITSAHGASVLCSCSLPMCSLAIIGENLCVVAPSRSVLTKCAPCYKPREELLPPRPSAPRLQRPHVRGRSGRTSSLAHSSLTLQEPVSDAVEGLEGIGCARYIGDEATAHSLAIKAAQEVIVEDPEKALSLLSLLHTVASRPPPHGNRETVHQLLHRVCDTVAPSAPPSSIALPPPGLAAEAKFTLGLAHLLIALDTEVAESPDGHFATLRPANEKLVGSVLKKRGKCQGVDKLLIRALCSRLGMNAPLTLSRALCHLGEEGISECERLLAPPLLSHPLPAGASDTVLKLFASCKPMSEMIEGVYLSLHDYDESSKGGTPGMASVLVALSAAASASADRAEEAASNLATALRGSTPSTPAALLASASVFYVTHDFATAIALIMAPVVSRGAALQRESAHASMITLCSKLASEVILPASCVDSERVLSSKRSIARLTSGALSLATCVRYVCSELEANPSLVARACRLLKEYGDAIPGLLVAVDSDSAPFRQVDKLCSTLTRMRTRRVSDRVEEALTYLEGQVERALREGFR